MASESELGPGATSLPEAFSLATAWLDGDVTAVGVASSSSTAANDDANNGSSSNDAAKDAAKALLADAAQQQTTSIERAIVLLIKLQSEISRAGLLSKNEGLDDGSTSSLELLGVEYHLGRAHLMLPTHNISPPPADAAAADADGSNIGGHNGTTTNSGPSSSLLRKRNITRAAEYYHAFLKRLEQLGEDMLPEAALNEYHALLDLEDDIRNDESVLDRRKASKRMIMNPSQKRQTKIARYQRKKATTQRRAQWQSQLQRRERLGMAEDEPMEGRDRESLCRTLFVETLRMHAEESLEELQSCEGELEMLEMALKMEGSGVGGRGGMVDSRMNRGAGRPPPQSDSRVGPDGRRRQQADGPLQMTQITQNPLTGELEYAKQRVANGQLKPVQQIKRQQIAEGVFKPSWNLPTMSLEELGDRERADAIRRGEQQRISEAEAVFKPRRYEQLERDGMEDDAGLVEASAKLDREWDEWKEENPRGSGNKMGERGDRNF